MVHLKNQQLREWSIIRAPTYVPFEHTTIERLSYLEFWDGDDTVFKRG